MCPECNGAGKVLSKCNHQRKCQCCKNGCIEWTQETRFAYFAQVLPVTYSRFKSYNIVINQIVNWLIECKTLSIESMRGKIENEYMAVS